MPLVNGVHVLVYTTNPEADRMFFRDVLGFRSVDVGGGWLIFALPPAEAAFHPIGDNPGQQHAGHQLLGSVIYLMCDDLRRTVASLKEKGVTCTAISEEPWGIKTTIPLPSGGEVGLYQPAHETALRLSPPMTLSQRD
jgi:catechol 2,3-dioxygenase-like lactoylglutathione lyase family enzyme